jgi:hypothetical protein
MPVPRVLQFSAMDEVSLRDHLEDVTRERNERLDERFRAQQAAIDKAEANLAEVLRGFPQEYTRAVTADLLREQITTIQRDHVTRREFESVRSAQGKIVGALVLLAAVIPVGTAVVAHLLSQ